MTEMLDVSINSMSEKPAFDDGLMINVPLQMLG